jgi:DNA-binding LacI/PurR family transcriptional regulator
MPFRIERQAAKTLTDQVAEGLRHAIATGHFKPGDVLPTKLEMAAALGVNDITIRRALAVLKQEGVVAPKPRRGILVCDRTRHSWRGHVLFCSWSGPDMYYHTVQAAEISRRLHAGRFLVTDLHLDGDAHHSHYAELLAILETRSVDLVLSEGGGWVQFLPGEITFSQVLARSGIPYVQLDGKGTAAMDGAAAGIVLAHEQAYRALTEHCRECGIRRALLVVPGLSVDPSRHPLLAKVMQAAGVQCEWLEASKAEGFCSPESVERGGLAAMRAWLAGQPALPDLIYFDDDFLARGGLLALMQHGLRIPEDVQVATWANRGLGPVFDKPLTRIEMDPVAHGVAIAERVLAHLENGDGPRTIELTPKFIVGETTRVLYPSPGTATATE